MSDHKVVHISWVDSASVGGGLWVSRDEIDPSCLTVEGLMQQTIGFLLEESRDAVLLAQSVGPDRVGAVLAIPVCAIKSRRQYFAPAALAKEDTDD
jgi:hypothetical protein